MRKIIQRTQIILLVLVCPLLLTACSDFEWSIIFDYFVVWAEENGWVADEQVMPGAIAADLGQDALDDLLNTDLKVQLDGLDVVGDIQKSEALAAEALAAHDPSMLDAAKELRPNDWTIYETEAVIWGAAQNGAAADDALFGSDERLRQSLEQGGDCLSARREQLETRLTITWDEIMRIEGGPGNPQTGATLDLRKVHELTRMELESIKQEQYTDFCQ